MKRLILFSAILVFAGAGPALAEDEGDDFARNGIYAGVNMAGVYYTEVEDDVKNAIEALGYSGNTDMERPLGLGVHVGYRFHPHLSGEVEFLWFTNSLTDFTGVLGGDPDANEVKFDAYKFETLNLTGNLKGYLLTGRIQPFLLAGGGLMHLNARDKVNLGTTSSGDAFVARFGGGVDLYLNPHVLFVVEGGYLLPTGKLDRMKGALWSVGLNYRF